MSSNTILDSIKQTLRASMPRDGKAFLYGSRARGDHRPGSDWDILLLLDKDVDEGKPIYALMQLGWRLNETISPVSYTTDEWRENAFTPFYHNVKDEGIQIYGTE